MPAERRPPYSVVKPVKTERTHEENQERAYIAASRRSDRSLEARIESARRASEIHKKRTGRALRVTEQDVVNEEMYEEEDDDLPSQYQRLNAHLQTSSWLFNRRLQDYIATQQGVRNMFMNQQFPGQQASTFNSQMLSTNNLVPGSAALAEPKTFSPTTPTFTQQQQPYSPQGFQSQQQAYRHSPYSIPQRPQSHQRSASVATDRFGLHFAPVTQPSPAVTTSVDTNNRRLSLPPRAFEAGGATQPSPDAAVSSPSALSSTAQPLEQHAASSQHASVGTPSTSTSGHGTPQLQSEHISAMPYQFGASAFGNSQVLDCNPLSMSLPPESQQFVGSVLDPNDPRTSLFMSGSENLPQPFTGTYTYNPNLSPKASQPLASGAFQSGITQTLAPEQLFKADSSAETANSTAPALGLGDTFNSTLSYFTPTTFDGSSYFDNFYSSNGNGSLGDSFEDNFVNWDH